MPYFCLLTDENQKALLTLPFSERIKIAFSRVVTIYSKEEMFEYAVQETVSAELADLEAGVISNSDRTAETAVSDDGLAPLNEDISEREFYSWLYDKSPPAPDVVSVNGLEAMICSFLGGVGEFSRGDIEELFKLVDTDESGYIDKDEFDHFLDLATGEEQCDSAAIKQATMALDRNLAKSISWRASLDSTAHENVMSKEEEMIGDAETIRYMEGLVHDKDKPLGDWAMFYCGASTPIEKILKGIKKKYHMDLGVEKFDW